MSSQFWVGVIVIVLLLELVRITISTVVLVHVLTSDVFRRAGEEEDRGRNDRESHIVRARREAALPSTMDAVRQAMDEVASERPGAGVQRAIDALDDYTGQRVEAVR